MVWPNRPTPGGYGVYSIEVEKKYQPREEEDSRPEGRFYSMDGWMDRKKRSYKACL